MKNALQIYGELRTFDICMPSILNFISYYETDFDVFLLIDRNHDSLYLENSKNNYSVDNMKKLIEMLGEDRIKVLEYVDALDQTHRENENKLQREYDNKWNIFKSKYNCVKNDFVCKLIYRKYVLNNLRKCYETKHTIKYDFIIRTRFDIKTNENILRLNYTTLSSPIMCSDIFVVGTPEFINEEANVATMFPLTPNVFFDKNLNLIEEKCDKYKDMKGDKFWDNIWIFMPELNIRLYLMEKNIKFIEAWWLNPRNLGFSIKR